MSRTVCLRCDWEPDEHPAGVRSGPCPRCGVALYTVPEVSERLRAGMSPPRVEAERRLGVPPDGGASLEVGWSPVALGGPERAVGRAVRATLTAAVVLVLLAGAAWSFAHGRSRSPVAGGARAGSLVYDGVDAAGDRRLWQLDLSTGAVRRGLEFDDVVDLQRVRPGGHTALGFTRQFDDGTQEAYLASGPSVYGHPQPLVAGDLVSWDAAGASVVAARRGIPEGDCHRGVSIAVADLNLGTRERVYSDRRSCADLLSVGRSGVRTSVSVERGGHVGTFSVGRRTLHAEISDHLLVSTSPQGDLLVTPATPGDFPGLAPIRSRKPSATPAARATGSTVLYWPGLGGPAPLGDDQVVVDRVLAWSDDGSSALVVADVGSVPSVLVTSAVPAPRETARLVARVSGPVTGGTLASDGTAYLAMAGRFMISRGAAAVPLDVPAAAPTPLGPVVWLP